MDQGKPSSSNSRNPQRPRSASVSDLIRNHGASILSHYPSMAPLPGFYGNFLHHDNMIPPQSPSPTSVNFHWHAVAASPGSESSTNRQNVPQASSSTNLHPGPPSFLDSPHGSLHPSDAASTSSTRGQQIQVPAAASNDDSSSPEVELTEAERAAASDEKRRRNTAASGTTVFLYHNRCVNICSYSTFSG